MLESMAPGVRWSSNGDLGEKNVPEGGRRDDIKKVNSAEMKEEEKGRN